MSLSADVQRGAMIRPELEPLENRLTLRRLLLIVAVVAAVFAACANLVQSSTPETITSSWTDRSGGFVEVGLAETAYSHLLISQRSFEDIKLTRRHYLAFPKYSRTILRVNGKKVKLARQPTIIFVDEQGEVHTGVCPVEFDEILRLTGSLPNSPSGRSSKVFSVTSKWLRQRDDLQWPPALREAFLEQ